MSRLLILLAALSGCASYPTASNTQTRELELQAKAWDDAIVMKNVNAISENMADDFLQISSQGAVSNKEQFLKAITSQDLKIHPYSVEGQTVRVFGNVALITGTTDMTGTYKDRSFHTHYRYTDTYVFNGKQWRVVQVQTTEIVH